MLRRVHPLLSARLAALMHPVGAALLALLGAPAAAVFAMLHGAGNGILTIAKGTLPLVLFGPHGYGHRQGLLMVPARIAQALAPWLFGLCLDRWGAGALWLSAALGLLAFGALLALAEAGRRGRRAPRAPGRPVGVDEPLTSGRRVAARERPGDRPAARDPGSRDRVAEPARRRRRTSFFQRRSSDAHQAPHPRVDDRRRAVRARCCLGQNQPIGLRLVRRVGWQEQMGKNRCVVGDLYRSSPDFPSTTLGSKLCTALEFAYRNAANEFGPIPRGDYEGFVRSDGAAAGASSCAVRPRAAATASTNAAMSSSTSATARRIRSAACCRHRRQRRRELLDRRYAGRDRAAEGGDRRASGRKVLLRVQT